jgi:hypothetical protein
MTKPIKPIRVAFSLSPEEAVWLEENVAGSRRLGKKYNYSGACQFLVNEAIAFKRAKSVVKVADNDIDIDRKDCEENGRIGNGESTT